MFPGTDPNTADEYTLLRSLQPFHISFEINGFLLKDGNYLNHGNPTMRGPQTIAKLVYTLIIPITIVSGVYKPTITIYNIYNHIVDVL